MTTSNKLLLWAGAAIVLNICSYTFLMRNAYQTAIANPVGNQVKIPLKAMKYLNLNHYSDVSFEYGSTYKILVDRPYQDSLRIGYQGDTLNIDLANVREVIVVVPVLPQIRMANSNREDREIKVTGEVFKSGNFDIFFEQSSELILGGSHFDNVTIRSPKGIHLELEKTQINNLTVQTGKKSLVKLNNANVQSNNIVLGDSSKIVSSQFVNGKLTKDLLIK